MNISEIQSICKKLPGVTEDIKWSDHLCFNVGGKMFLITAPDNMPVSASIKVSPENFELLPEQEGIIPAPYLARHQWVFIDDINRWNRKQWGEYIADAHKLVAEKLPLKQRQKLGLAAAAPATPVKKSAKAASKKIPPAKTAKKRRLK